MARHGRAVPGRHPPTSRRIKRGVGPVEIRGWHASLEHGWGDIPLEDRTWEYWDHAIVSVEVAVGDQVQEGDELVILESMKMEIPVEAEHSGTVTRIFVAAGQGVAEGDPSPTCRATEP
jgi:acetyl-CoA carboxylase biotin carboxyl carrier protein